MTDAIADPTLGGMNLMGHPIKPWRRQRAYEHAKAMGLPSHLAEECVSCVAAQYERDRPFEAQDVALKYLDLIGHYRLMAALLADPDTAEQTAAAIAQGDPIAPRLSVPSMSDDEIKRAIS